MTTTGEQRIAQLAAQRRELDQAAERLRATVRAAVVQGIPVAAVARDHPPHRGPLGRRPQQLPLNL